MVSARNGKQCQLLQLPKMKSEVKGMMDKQLSETRILSNPSLEHDVTDRSNCLTAMESQATNSSTLSLPPHNEINAQTIKRAKTI